MIGSSMKVEPAIWSANWLSFCPLSSERPTDKVYSFSSFAIMSGHKKLFQLPMKVRMTCTAKIGVEIGSTICRTVRNSPAPSRRALHQVFGNIGHELPKQENGECAYQTRQDDPHHCIGQSHLVQDQIYGDHRYLSRNIIVTSTR
jgi:hypothetical protein